MEAAPPLPAKGKGPLIKGILLLAFIDAAVAAVRFTHVTSYLTPDGLGRLLGMAVALFVFSFFIPKIIRKAKGE